jgi:plasmid stabilization system protein ParE
VELADYYSLKGGIDLALRFLDELDATLASLREMPGLGGTAGFTNPNNADLRLITLMVFDKIVVYYRISPEAIEVVHVIHGARDRDAIFGE